MLGVERLEHRGEAGPVGRRKFEKRVNQNGVGKTH